jgi:hypothetical protein
MSDISHDPTSAEFLNEIQKTKDILAKLRRDRKLALLAISKQRRAQAGTLSKSHLKASAEMPAAEGGETLNLLRGAAAIARFTNDKPSSVYYKHRNGRYQTPEGAAVWKSGPKELTGSPRLLRLVSPYEE